MNRLSGKVALITGAARGMGASHARHFIAEGARVLLTDVLDDEGIALADELGDSARYVHLDVANYNEWQVATEIAAEEWGAIDVLVNNAGIIIGAPVEDYPLDGWDRILAINLTGVFYGIRAVAPGMKHLGHGSIINVSSTAGMIGLQGVSGYNATKFGVRGLTKGAALDLGRYNIRVNSVHPGAIETEMIANMNLTQERVALHRTGTPSEVSHLMVYLASDESSFSTGAEFIADGGETTGIAHFP
jgi:3alpha(or 20beta)-hydroxysteroid dehydrogenase